MINLTEIADFDAVWGEKVRASAMERIHDDALEQNFWKQYIENKSGYAPDPSSRCVLRRLLPILESHGVETALEIGPGWGNYTMDLARFCRSVDCVDISADILDYIRRIGAEQGLTNIGVHHKKWEDFREEKAYDLVFGYNCFYRQESLRECFTGMSRAAKKLCVAGMNNGPTPPWTRDLRAAGVRIREDWKDYIYFVNVLYQMGYQPQLVVLPFEKPLRYASMEELIRREIAAGTEDGYDRTAAEAIARRYFRETEDGSFTGSTNIHCALVCWDPGWREGE